jgi:hypothetical protein
VENARARDGSNALFGVVADVAAVRNGDRKWYVK